MRTRIARWAPKQTDEVFCFFPSGALSHDTSDVLAHATSDVLAHDTSGVLAHDCSQKKSCSFLKKNRKIFVT
jgi:hypothetical protein